MRREDQLCLQSARFFHRDFLRSCWGRPFSWDGFSVVLGHVWENLCRRDGTALGTLTL